MSPMLDIQRRHAEVFRIRMGDKAANGAPRKLTDAIRITSPNRSVVDAFVEVYGGEPSEWEQQWQAYLPVTSLPVMVLPGQSLTQWWELYRKTVCERRCDGFTESLSGKPCMCPADITERMQAKGACRPMTRISVVCPEVAVVGAGSLVSHGMIAAETLPQSVKVAESALERGLMVPAVLRIIVHEGKRHYVVPQLEIVGVSLNTLATGEMPTPAIAPQQRAIGSGGGVSPASPPTSVPPAAPARALPPLPGEVRAGAVDQNVVDLLAERIAALSPEAKAALKTDWQTAGFPPLSRLPLSDAANASDLILHHETSDDSSTGTQAPPAQPNDAEYGSAAGVGPSPVPPGAAGGGEAQGAPEAPPPAPSRPGGPSPKQLGLIHGTLKKLGVAEDDKHRYCSDLLSLPAPVASLNDLTGKQVRDLIDALLAEETGVPA